MTAGAFNETAVNHNDFPGVRSQQGLVILSGFAAGFLGIPSGHVRNRKQELFSAGDVFFFYNYLQRASCR